MAQLKDLIISGAARILGPIYSTLFVGNLRGNADSATNDSASQPINSTYIKDIQISNGTNLVFTKGDGTDSEPLEIQDTTYETGTSSVSGITKLYSTLGENEDGALTQKAVHDYITTSPAFSGTPTAPNPNLDDNSTRIATTEWVRDICQSMIEELVETGAYKTDALLTDETGEEFQLVTSDTDEEILLNISINS